MGSLRDNLAGSGIELVTLFDYRGPGWIHPERMRRALINMAGNASDAMPDGGTLPIATRMAGGHWELELRDTGTGVPPELRAKVFEPSVTSGKEHGTGLSLAIVHKIVEAHGGAINVWSRVAGEEAGQAPGSVFLMRLPVGAPPTTGDRA